VAAHVLEPEFLEGLVNEVCGFGAAAAARSPIPHGRRQSDNLFQIGRASGPSPGPHSGERRSGENEE